MDRIPYDADGRDLELLPQSDGRLEIWEHPQEDEVYFFGGDSAEGLEHGDWSAGSMIKGSDCSQVAEFRGHLLPDEWGVLAARICWYFNKAVLAFETWPSAHGITAHNAARAYGYPSLYWRAVTDIITKRQTDKPGWSTDLVSKPKMFDRMRRAIADGSTIHSQNLLAELMMTRSVQAQEEREVGKPVRKNVTRGHDDCMIAWAIGLMVRDQRHYVAAEDDVKKMRPASLQEQAWAKVDQREGRKGKWVLPGQQRASH